MFFTCGAIFFSYVPHIHAQVLFSEIAWMGTDTSANDEWIELYNFSGASTDVTGWTITLNDEPFVTLSGTIAPHGVVVLERTNDDVLPGTAFQIYTGALNNAGATLKMKDASGAVSDEAIGGTNWENIGGSNMTGHLKMTPQRTRTGTWVTGTPTPGAENVQVSEPVPEGTSDTSDDTNTETKTVAKKAGGGSSKSSSQVKAKLPEVFSLKINAPKVVYVNQRVNFEAVPNGIGPTLTRSLVYSWNYGDTYTGFGVKNLHTFAYAGEYIVVAKSSYKKQLAIARHEIKVLPVAVTLLRTEAGDVRIKNDSPEEFDLGGFTLRGDTSFTFPEFTIIKPKGMLTISEDRVKSSSKGVALFDTTSMLVVRDGGKEENPSFAQKIKTVPTIPQASPKVITQNQVFTDISEELPDSTPPEVLTNTVIQIGNTESEVPRGFFSRFVGKLTSFFK